jgi:hypothetical protein
MALEATVLVMILLAAVLGAAFSGAVMITRTANADYRNARVFYAAEAGAEDVIAQLADFLEDGAIADSELGAIVTPTLAGFSFPTPAATRVGGVMTETITDGTYAGLYSLTQRVDVRSQALDSAGNSATVIVSAKAQAIPIFQFGIFYEEDLEMTNGPAMEFAGWVHSNGNIYVSSANAWYRDRITTPSKLYWQRKDKDQRLNGVYVNDAGGSEIQLDFDSRSHTAPSDFRQHSDMYFSGRLRTDAYAVDSLRVPLPAGMPPIAVMLPRNPGDDDLTRRAKMAWKADWYIEVDLSMLTTNSATLPQQICLAMTVVRPGGRETPSLADCAGIFRWTFQGFYEGREQRRADVLDINMRALGDWAQNASRVTRILYVTFKNSPVPTALTDASGDGFYPVVRLYNGSELTGGALSMATDHPVYVRGNYNTVNWVPAAVFGDAITLLSNSWNDANQQGPALRNASNTQYYFAILAGHSETACDWMLCGTNAYGGGVENYPRFLESWSGRTALYRGSLVSLHISAKALAAWSYGAYYQAPNRDWQFDVRFRDPANLPPGTPVVGNVIRTAFRPVY